MSHIEELEILRDQIQNMNLLIFELLACAQSLSHLQENLLLVLLSDLIQ